MAFDKKPSTYSERGAIGSAEELDAYGVWVKSEPQDLTAGLADTVNFDAEAVPYEADFDIGFGADFDSGFEDFGSPNFGIAGFEPEIPEISVEEDDDTGGFDDGITAERSQGTEEASTQLLMKIADELSMIRSELSTLKKEFAGIRVSSPGVKEEAPPSGFFAGDDDEKIALTGDEMENIISSADYSDEEDLSYDPLREADEAALKELSEQNDSLASEEPTEEINIDFNNLGINLDNDLEEAPDELPPLEAAVADDFETLSFDSLSTDETPALETEEIEEEAVQGFAEELVPLEEDEELRNLRMEGALPLTPPPDNTVYLEEDPFALDDGAEGLSLDEDSVSEESPLEETTLEEPVIEEAAPEEPALEEIALEEIALEDIAVDEPALEETALEETALEDIALEEPALEETALEEPAEEPVLEETALEEPALEEPVLDETALEETAIEETASEEPVLEEPVIEEAAPEEPASADTISSDDAADLVFEDVSFDLDFDDFSGDSSLSLEDESIDQAIAAAPEESPAPLEEPPEEKASEEEASEEEAFDAGSVELSDGFESSESLAPLEETSEEAAFDPDSLDLSEAVIDEPDLSAGLVEPPLEEPVLGDISFKDDISLEMDDFGTDIDFDAEDSEAKDTGKTSGKDDPGSAAVDDSLAQVIPEGFEINAEEAAAPFDDDLEAFADDDLSIADGGIGPLDTAVKDEGDEDLAIPSDLKKELKSVLSYMDHLLESLPEEKIEEFAKSEYFDTYKKIFKELGLV